MKTLAVDCSTKSIAYAMFEGNKLKFFGEIEFPGKKTFDRLSVGQHIMNQLVDKFDPDKVAWESAVYVQNKKTVILLAHAIGAYVIPLTMGAEVEAVHPLLWQNAIGNGTLNKAEKEKIKEDNPGHSAPWYQEKGRELRKQRTIDFVKMKFGIHAVSDNVSDAIALGYSVTMGGE